MVSVYALGYNRVPHYSGFKVLATYIVIKVYRENI